MQRSVWEPWGQRRPISTMPRFNGRDSRTMRKRFNASGLPANAKRQLTAFQPRRRHAVRSDWHARDVANDWVPARRLDVDALTLRIEATDLTQRITKLEQVIDLIRSLECVLGVAQTTGPSHCESSIGGALSVECRNNRLLPRFVYSRVQPFPSSSGFVLRFYRRAGIHCLLSSWIPGRSRVARPE